VLAALALAGAGLLVAPASATTPDGWPDGAWTACPDDTAQYCLQEATVTPAGGVATPAAELGLSAWVSTLPGYVTSFNWAVEGWDGDGMPAEVRAGDVRLVVRTGTFMPRATMAIANGLRVTRSTDGDGNTTLTITGHPVHMDWTTGDLFGSCGAGQDCGDDDTMADPNGSRYAFSGNTQDLETWGEGYVSTLDGMYVATDAQARPTAILFGSYPEPSWSMSILGNPHLDVDGNPVRGSFNAWMPPTYFASLGTDAETAAATGFDVVSREGADSVSLPATVAVQDGGVAIDVPDLGYSVHSIDVIGHASTAGVGVATPDAPGRVAVRPVSGGLGVSWAAPASDGNTPITSYTARAFTAPTGGAIAGRCAATTTSCAITGLTVGTTYYVAVSATNALGEGSSATPRAAGTAVDLPSAPRAVTLAPGNGRLVASWLAPRSAGAAPLTRYTARGLPHPHRRRPGAQLRHGRRQAHLHAGRPDQRHPLLRRGHRGHRAGRRPGHRPAAERPAHRPEHAAEGHTADRRRPADRQLAGTAVQRRLPGDRLHRPGLPERHQPPAGEHLHRDGGHPQLRARRSDRRPHLLRRGGRRERGRGGTRHGPDDRHAPAPTLLDPALLTRPRPAPPQGLAPSSILEQPLPH
jgi:hypothetical protein